MFKIKINPDKSTFRTLELIKNTFGSIPPHFELLATLNPLRFEMFMKEVLYLNSHENIHQDFFAFIRLHVASKENFKYCIMFNTKLLKNKKYSKEVLSLVIEDIYNIPLDKRHKVLALTALKSIYDSEIFLIEDIKLLEEHLWTSSDIYDAIDHSAFLFKNSKVIKAYLK